MMYLKWPQKVAWLEAKEMGKDFTSSRTDKGSYLVSFLFMTNPFIGMKSLPSVELKSSLPLEMADLDGSKESFLNWVEKYNFPSLLIEDRKNLKTDDGRVISDFLSLSELRGILANVKAATTLWRCLLEKDITKLRQCLGVDKDEGILVVKVSDIHGEINVKTWVAETEVDLSKKDSNYIFSSAAYALEKIINYGLLFFPPESSIEVPTPDEDGEIIFNAVSKGTSPMSFIWTTIRDDLCRKGSKNWHFQRCADCNRWEDIAPPRRRSTWTRCDDCAAKARKAGNLQRAKASQDKKRNKQS